MPKWIAVACLSVAALAWCAEQAMTQSNAQKSIREQVRRLDHRPSIAQYTGDQCYAVVEERSTAVWVKASHLRGYMQSFPGDHYLNAIRSLGLYGNCASSLDHWLTLGRVRETFVTHNSVQWPYAPVTVDYIGLEMYGKQ